jgi:acetone carboxylase gamma subunit
MRLSVRQLQEPAGNAGAVRVVREWICPDCDYFEDAEAGEG